MTRNERIERAAKSLSDAAIKYDAAIQGCANSPGNMASFCTAEGDDLDSLYAAWLESAHAARAALALPEEPLPCGLAFDGRMVCGDKESIQAVKQALHEAGTVTELRARLAAQSAPVAPRAPVLLTKERIIEIDNRAFSIDPTLGGNLMQFARAIEQASLAANGIAPRTVPAEPGFYGCTFEQTPGVGIVVGAPAPESVSAPVAAAEVPEPVARIQWLWARTDELMLEYCHDEMTVEQVAEWAAHQRAAPKILSDQLDAALNTETSSAQASAEARGVARWIPVDERLPEFHTEVLIALNRTAIPCTGQLCRVVGQPGEVEWLYPRENHWPGEPAPQVTHWMPLPEHPNVGPDGNFIDAAIAQASGGVR